MSSPLGYPVGYRWWHLCVVNIPHGGDELSFHNYILTTLNFMYDDRFHIQNFGDFTGVKKYVYYLCILRDSLIDKRGHGHFNSGFFLFFTVLYWTGPKNLFFLIR